METNRPLNWLSPSLSRWFSSHRVCFRGNATMAVGCEQKSLNLTPFFCLQCQQKGDDVNAKRAGESSWRRFATFRKICMEKGGHSTKRLRFRGSAIGARLKLDCAKWLYRKKQLGCSCVRRDVETTRARPGAKHASKPQNKQPASWSSGRNNKKQSVVGHHTDLTPNCLPVVMATARLRMFIRGGRP